jgi:hypothetical protein
MEYKDMRWGAVDSIHLAQDRDQWRAVVNPRLLEKRVEPGNRPKAVMLFWKSRSIHFLISVFKGYRRHNSCSSYRTANTNSASAVHVTLWDFIPYEPRRFCRTAQTSLSLFTSVDACSLRQICHDKRLL